MTARFVFAGPETSSRHRAWAPARLDSSFAFALSLFSDHMYFLTHEGIIFEPFSIGRKAHVIFLKWRK